MEYSLEKNVSISSGWMFASDSVSLPRLDNPTGACPTHRRQWADFLVSLMAPLHRQYKTARTETLCHLLLKTWQMAIQTSASRGYVLFISGNKRHTKVLKLSVGLRTQSVECSKLGKTRIIADANPGWLEMPHFLNRMYPMHSSWNQQISCLSYYLSGFSGKPRGGWQRLLSAGGDDLCQDPYHPFPFERYEVLWIR